MNLLSAEEVVKVFHQRGKRIYALRGVSLSLSAGKIIGFIGPNGAGKSTFLKLLLRYLYPSSGRLTLLGEPPGSPRVLERIGYLPEHPSFPLYLTGRELLTYVGRLKGMGGKELKERSEELLSLVGLREAQDRWISSYSKGMLQRLGLAQALMGRAEVLILDEPMTGLDPVGRREVKDLLQKLWSEGKTIFFSSHILEDVELICHDLVVIIKGEIRYSGPVANFLYDKGVSFQVMVEGTALPSEINGIPFQRVTSSLFLLSGIKEEDLSSLISLLIQKGMKIMEVKRSYTTLETRFLELLKGGE